MKKTRTILAILLVWGLSATVYAQAPAEKYPVDSASVEHAGVPEG